MMIVNALKTVCDFLLYFSFASLFAAYKDAWLLMGVVLGLAFLSSLILQKTNRAMAARLFCGLLPAFGLIAAKSTAELLVTAVILSFYLVLTLAGRNEIHYEDFKYWFGIPAVPVIVILGTCLAKWPIRPAATVCSALYLFLGVLVLRRKRMGTGVGFRLRLMNLTELAAVAVFGVLACILLFAALKSSRKVLEVLLMPLGYLVNGVIYLFEYLTALLVKYQPEETTATTEAVSTAWEDVQEPAPTMPESGEAAEQALVGMLGRVLLIILSLALLFYLLHLFYRMLRNVRKEEAGRAGDVEEGDETETRRIGWKRRRKKKAVVLSNNEKIRKIYKDYLFFIRTCGIVIGRQTTSRDVLEATESLTAAKEAERMRELYIRARYHDAEEMSSAEVEEAEALLASIKAQAENEKRRQEAEKAGRAETPE